MTAALSLATDVGTGQPLEHAVRTCLLAMRAAETLGVTPAEQSTLLYSTLLRFLGCTADAAETSALAGGDEIAFNAAMAQVVMADDREALPHLLRHLGEDLPLARRIGRLGAALSDPGGKARSLSAHCEVGARLASRMGLPPDVTTALAHAYERWDGKGLPAGLAGDEIPLAMRIAVVARDVDVWTARTGWQATADVVRRRRGRAYDPAVADIFIAHGPHWLSELGAFDPWDALLEAEPPPIAEVSADRLDEVLAAFADFADLKSPWFAGHSRAVSALARAAASTCGLDAVEVGRAGLVHDLGVVGVPGGVWSRTGAVSSEGWDRIQSHPQVGSRILARCSALRDLATHVSAHHERADGSGYHRGIRDVPHSAQVLGAADVYVALTESRPHRPAMPPDAAARVLGEEADSGRFARTATDAVVSAVGHRPAVPNLRRPAGLTEREVDVLRLLARGRSNREVAASLGISAKTVGTHIEHIYAKAGVTTRAGATLFAIESDLLRT